MRQIKPFYKHIFTVYELMDANPNIKDNVRNFINLRLKAFSDKKWEDLSELEQKQFTYIVIRDGMLEKYVDISKRARIKKNIDTEISNTLIKAKDELEKYNKRQSYIEKTYYNDSDSDMQKEKSYQQFCKDFKEINPKYTPPSLEEWIYQNKENPKRIYDYIMDEKADLDEHFDRNYPTREEINNILIKIILKKFDINIDESRIIECLTFINGHRPFYDNGGELLDKVDPSLPISEEEQKEIILNNLTLCKYELMLRKLDFLR